MFTHILRWPSWHTWRQVGAISIAIFVAASGGIYSYWVNVPLTPVVVEVNQPLVFETTTPGHYESIDGSRAQAGDRLVIRRHLCIAKAINGILTRRLVSGDQEKLLTNLPWHEPVGCRDIQQRIDLPPDLTPSEWSVEMTLIQPLNPIRDIVTTLRPVVVDITSNPTIVEMHRHIREMDLQMGEVKRRLAHVENEQASMRGEIYRLKEKVSTLEGKPPIRR